MTRPPLARILPLLNLLVFAGSWGWMAASSTSAANGVLRLAETGVVSAVFTALWFSPGWGLWRNMRAGLSSRGLFSVLVIMSPWVGLLFLLVASGLWWTQRPPSFRLFLVWGMLNWSLAWSLPELVITSTVRAARARTAVFLLSATFGLAAIQGLVFGLSTFGCGTSAVMGVLASVLLAAGTIGTDDARVTALTSVIATLVTFAGVEAAVRVSGLGANLREVSSREIARQFLSLTPPGSAFVNQPKALDEFGPALVEINSMGIRGPELPIRQADVLLLGDSFVEARQLPWERTLGPRLQDALRRRSIGLRVVSHGMRGWSPLLEWNWYLKVGRTLRPKVVLLFFFWNDLWPVGDEATTFRVVTTPDGRPDHFDVEVEPAWLWYQPIRTLRLIEGAWKTLNLGALRRAFLSTGARTSSKTASDDGAADRLARSLVQERPLTRPDLEAILTRPESELDPGLRALASTSFWPGLRPLRVWTDAQLRAAKTTEQELALFANDVAADGGRLVVVYVPNPLQVSPNECGVGRLFDRVDRGVTLPEDSGVQEWLRSLTGRHGLELIDPSMAMRTWRESNSDSRPLYLRADCHWSEAGHLFMADWLADWVARSRIS